MIAGKPAAATISASSLESDLTVETSPSTEITQSIDLIGIDLGTEKSMVSRDNVIFMASELQPAVTKDVLTDLITKIEELLQEHRWPETVPLAEELEKRLRSQPRKGSEIRQGWTVLARLENHSQMEAKLRGQSVDITRLRALRMEAEDVID